MLVTTIGNNIYTAQILNKLTSFVIDLYNDFPRNSVSYLNNLL